AGKRTNPMGLSRALTGSGGFSRSDAEIPRGSLDTVGCSDMFEQPKSAEISRVFGPSTSLSPEAGGFSARWEMRPLRRRPGAYGEQERISSRNRATPSVVSLLRVRLPQAHDSRSVQHVCSELGEWSSSPLEVGAVGGTSLAVRVMQLVPRSE